MERFMRFWKDLCVINRVYAFLIWKSGFPVGDPLFILKFEGFSLDGEGADDVGDQG